MAPQKYAWMKQIKINFKREDNKVDKIEYTSISLPRINLQQKF